jgi:hypothetical protein
MSSSTVPHHQSTSKVIEATWDQVASGNFPEAPWRAIFRQAVQEVADKAKTALPDSHGRIDSAVKIVLAGDVKLLIDGTAKVASQSNGTTTYFQVNGACTCKDFPKAPANFCKHRLAFGIAKRATVLAKDRLADQDAVARNGHLPEDEDPGLEGTLPPAEASSTPWPDAEPGLNAVSAPPATACIPLPEAASSINLYITMHGYKAQLTLRDMDETRLIARMEAILKRFPAPPPPQDPPASTKPAEPELPENFCRLHACEMRRWEREGRSWYSHKLADNTWCRGR